MIFEAFENKSRTVRGDKGTAVVAVAMRFWYFRSCSTVYGLLCAAEELQEYLP
jgi:hypothetical protein